MLDRDKKSPRESEVSYTTVVLPEDTNTHGNLFGGRLLAMLDKAAFICAARHGRRNCVTASMEHIDFLSPVRQGFIVMLRGRLNFVHRSSMEIGLEAEAENPLTGTRTRTCSAVVTFIALGDDGRPTEVPGLELETDEDRRRYQEGLRRFEARKKAEDRG